MEHVLSYRSFSEGYDNFSVNDLNEDNFDEIIDNIALYEGKLKLFKKLKIWSKSPKVKKLQKKANKERLKGIKEEVKIKKQTIDAITDKKEIDIDRIKEILLTKRYAIEKTAQTYEKEAGAIANGSEYLMKIIRVEAAKGIIEQNKLKMEIADQEEQDALNAVNNEANKIIREDLFDIKQKMKDPTYSSPEAKDVKKDVDYGETDVKDLVDDTEMPIEQKEAILKKKWKNEPDDNHFVKNFKRSQLRRELRILHGEKVIGTKYDKDLKDIEKSSGVDVSSMEHDEIEDWAKKEKKRKADQDKGKETK